MDTSDRTPPESGLLFTLQRDGAGLPARATVADAAGRLLAAGPADPSRLQYFPASFAAALTEDVLLGTPSPAAILAEIARVTRRGGSICLREADWSTLIVSPGPERLIERVRAALGADSHGAVSGPDLARWCRAAGLDVLSRSAESHVWTDRLTGGPAGGPEYWLAESVRRGCVSRDEAGVLQQEWTAAIETGTLLIAVTRWQLLARPSDAVIPK